MDIFILGMGHVGKALAARLRGAGHRVTGSTTTPEKVEELQQHADRVVVLRGSEGEKLAQAASGCEAIIVTVAPNVRNTRTVEERHQHYADVLVASCHSARLACPHVVFLSSFSVYGDGGAGAEPGQRGDAYRQQRGTLLALLPGGGARGARQSAGLRAALSRYVRCPR